MSAVNAVSGTYHQNPDKRQALNVVIVQGRTEIQRLYTVIGTKQIVEPTSFIVKEEYNCMLMNVVTAPDGI